MSRPEYVKCIARTHVDHKGESWCGRRVGMEFHFTGLDHAAENGAQRGRLVACPECVTAALKALSNGHDVPGVEELDAEADSIASAAYSSDYDATPAIKALVRRAMWPFEGGAKCG